MASSLKCKHFRTCEGCKAPLQSPLFCNNIRVLKIKKERFIMLKEMDKIQFESRSEVSEVMGVLEKYVEAYPREKDNDTVKRLYNLLDVMEMEW